MPGRDGAFLAAVTSDRRVWARPKIGRAFGADDEKPPKKRGPNGPRKNLLPTDTGQAYFTLA